MDNTFIIQFNTASNQLYVFIYLLMFIEVTYYYGDRIINELNISLTVL